MAITAAVVFTMTLRYVATSKLLIEPEPPRLMDVSTLLQNMQNDSATDDYAKTQYSLLRDDQLIAQVIRELRLESNPNFEERPGLAKRLLAMLPLGQRPPNARDRLGVNTASIDNYLKHLDVAPENGTRLVKVRFDSPDPTLAAQIVNTHVADFLARSQQIRSDASNAARMFLENELIRIKVQVEKSEAELNQYRDRTGILSFGEKDQESNEVARVRMEELNKALTAAQDARIKAEAEMVQVKSGAYDSLPDVVSNSLIQNARPEVDRLEAQYAEMASKYNDAYPPLREVRAKLHAAEGRLATEVSAIARATERKFAAAQLSENNLEAQVEQERRRDFARNDASLQDAVLAREVDANRAIYEAVLKRRNEIGVDGAAPACADRVVASSTRRATRANCCACSNPAGRFYSQCRASETAPISSPAATPSTTPKCLKGNSSMLSGSRNVTRSMDHKRPSMVTNPTGSAIPGTPPDGVVRRSSVAIGVVTHRCKICLAPASS